MVKKRQFYTRKMQPVATSATQVSFLKSRGIGDKKDEGVKAAALLNQVLQACAQEIWN